MGVGSGLLNATAGFLQGRDGRRVREQERAFRDRVDGVSR